MNVDDLTIREAKELSRLFGANPVTPTSFLQCGKSYLIRTVTMIYVGRLVDQNTSELLLHDCSWIPETDQWMDTLMNGTFNEIEPYIDPVIVSRSVILDATPWRHDLPKEQK